MRRRFVTLDVFTDQRFAGNPLAVVLESDGLDKSCMQAIAREFNLAETVFVMQPANPDHRAMLRIFTPKAELPFAGHPTVGTAVLLGCVCDSAGAVEMVLEETIGPVHCSVQPHSENHGYAAFILPRLPEKTEGGFDNADLARALGLTAEEIGFGGYRPTVWSAGVPVNFVPVRNLDAVQRAKQNGPLFDTAFARNPPGIAYVFCGEAREAGHHYHARMFAPALGIAEDPATGAAAAAFAGVIAETERLQDGDHHYVIEQGYEMQRPSQIELGMTIVQGRVVRATIGGMAIIVSDGHIEA